MKALLASVAVLAAIGCGIGPMPDPNEPADSGALQMDAVRRRMRDASLAFNERKARGEIDDRQYQALLAALARDLVKRVNAADVEDDEAWMLGEVMVTGRMWKEAETELERAVAHSAKFKAEKFTELGRWVEDSLKLARVEAELGKADAAIERVRGTFAVLDTAKAPILPAVLYEIVPNNQGKGVSLKNANLLVDAIEQHRKVIVDPANPAGKAFLTARPHHIRQAYINAAKLYSDAGKPELARQALQDADAAAAVAL